jgi:hypothetical protein
LRGGKFSSSSAGRRTRLQQRARRLDEAGRRRLGPGGKLGASEAVMAFEFEQPIHRLQIALHHHRMRNDHRLADARSANARNLPVDKPRAFSGISAMICRTRWTVSCSG